ncbi:FHA domain-containing protein [Mycolicibacterium moriokaense]|uniref:FHA domain-containing protein n=1 Tax=Mycolicibacterium moriokaense TaxID=39691 RepID=A0A318HCU2_9MYCO|nr:FHA domain-containing protein [Mycolicibacterium moriokaense]PXX06326.1 FHA domain-containing protein [Mycolicibacterium moriokaense]
MPTCAEGHTSAAADYCDVCGVPIASPPTQPTQVKGCPACEAPVLGRFCEVCGHDSELPPPMTAPPTVNAPASTEWTAVIDADRDFYQRVLANGGPDTVEFPVFFPERRIVLQGNTTLIGRRNREQGVEPEIDLGIHPADRGVSTQHAVLRIRDSGLTVTDLGSTNGTTLNDSEELLANGEETQLRDGDRIHLGAWTTITIINGR